MTDYRVTKFEIYNYSNIKQNKIILGQDIDEKAVRNIGQHYNKINNKETNYYDRFEKIYYHKCAYCGINTSINPAPLYEIDHFFNELQKTFGDEKSVDEISNLIFACRNCNQSKKEFKVNNIHDIIHPDGEQIGKVFNRGEHFEIVVSPEYYSNEIVQNFYYKMKFNYRFRKLDYLLLNLYFMKEKYSDKILYGNLFNRLLELRNSVPSLKKYK
ncbi:HNH endonuclease [Streptococcus saliviloxodontae]|uniref:HNH domain-containing protein n=1 Tax=Streptococcus saliviloxodontae TaxID=1349416 RepID=A0ABS2PNL3_9STRE|nr:HNH endonuclease [Streptococcus saliviloxodontae]MBM7637029.1 hypothetical protein [Streptococcus saliviloxodontae]